MLIIYNLLHYVYYFVDQFATILSIEYETILTDIGKTASMLHNRIIHKLHITSRHELL